MTFQYPSSAIWGCCLRWLCVLALAGAAGLSQAGKDGHDHDRARKALEAGEILPLDVILARVGRDFPGQVLDVELEDESDGIGSHWVYEIKLLRQGGALVKLYINGRDGTLIRRKGKGNAPIAP